MAEQNRVVRLMPDPAPVVKSADKPQTMEALADAVHAAITTWVRRHVDARLAQLESRVAELETRLRERS